MTLRQIATAHLRAKFPLNMRFLFEPLMLSLVLSFIPSADAASNEELEQQIGAVEGRLARVEKLLNNEVLLDLLQRLETLQRELQELRGDNERALHELGAIKARQRELYLDVDRRLQQLETGSSSRSQAPRAALPAPQAPDRPPPPATVPAAPKQQPKTAALAPTPSAAPAPARTAASEAEREAYRQAFNLLKEGRYDRSMEAFSRFLTEHPQSPYADNAQYWLAEANYVTRNYPVALTEFKKVVDGYPASTKVPDATLKLGFTYYELGEWEQAREVLTQLRSRYPNSSVARLAGERLQRMQQEGH